MDIARERIANMRGNTLRLNNLGLTELPPRFFEDLPTLEELYCDDNELTSLPTLPHGLKRLSCMDNKLTSLPPLPPTLVVLYCSVNVLTKLPPLPHALEFLCCDDNALIELPPLPSTLRQLYCRSNAITELPRLPLAVFILAVGGNPIQYPSHNAFARDLDFIKQWMDENPPPSYIKSANKV